MRYDNNVKKIYISKDDTDRLYMNFNLLPGETFIQYSGYNYREATVKEKIYDRFNQTFSAKGFYTQAAASELTWEYEYFGANIGIYYFEFGEQSISGHIGVTKYSLIMAKTFDSTGNVQYFTEHYKPEFSVIPVTKINNANFVMDFEVNHHWSHFFNPGTPFTGCNFIDSVRMYSYYSNGDSVINLPVMIPYNNTIIANPDYSVNTLLDTNLLQNGYNLYYRFYAKDKGIIPEYADAPDSGYYVCKWEFPLNIISDDKKGIEFRLDQNYPNPFNPLTTIKYSVPKDENLKLTVYNTLGQEVAELVNKEVKAGNYEHEFNASDLASGVYFYQLRAGDPSTSSGQVFVQTKKMILLK